MFLRVSMASVTMELISKMDCFLESAVKNRLID